MGSDKVKCCPNCTTEMFYREDQNYYVCPHCLWECWPPEKPSREKVTVKKNSMFYFGLAESTTAINSKPVNPPGVPCFKGGSKCGKKRKKPAKKDALQEYQT